MKLEKLKVNKEKSQNKINDLEKKLKSEKQKLKQITEQIEIEEALEIRKVAVEQGISLTEAITKLKNNNTYNN
ncbi:TPA: hypothetical protein ACP0O4_001653 [Streptococcus pyogenes]